MRCALPPAENSTRGGLRRHAISLVTALVAATPVAAQDSAACLPRDASRAVVTAVNERAELVLADDRVVKLAGIDVARPRADTSEPAGLPRRVLQNWLVGRSVSVEPLGSAPDRWNRVVAAVFAPPDASAPDDPPVSAAWTLVDAGLARARPSAERDPCMPALVAAEDDARRAKLGLWRDAHYAVIDAGDETALANATGRFVVVEGEVTRIGTGRTRTFINFGRSRGSFTAVVTKQALKRIESGGQAVRDLVGIRLRVRGILDTRFGPRIEIAGPQDIERL